MYFHKLMLLTKIISKLNLYIYIYVKVKFALEEVMKVQRGSRGIALLLL